MPRLGPDQVNACRAIATWGMRATSLILLTTGGYLVLKRIILGFAVGELSLIFQTFEEIGEGHSFSRGLAMIVFGALLGLLAARLARWVIAPPSTGCPGCGYEKIEGDRCPECGMTGFRSDTAPNR